MSEKKTSKLHEIVDTLEKEVIPKAKEGYEELSKGAQDLVPRLRRGWGRLVGYGKKIKEQVKGGKSGECSTCKKEESKQCSSHHRAPKKKPEDKD
ncbi:MAG: hypothetical protein JSR80_06795 [Verrucomicrobia bacterium]|nr:hypothetical protein [Verrucomicrobiota bacterium]